MRCPRCGTEMLRVGLEELVGAKVFVTLECPSCHYRMESTISGKSGRLGRKPKPGIDLE